jgi:2-polyprenyl-3-methyl-5-hydroxy-6-metoxy-1,4-benzoquinol methylase
MVYVSALTDTTALIFDGPVMYPGVDSRILTSSKWDEVGDSWELEELPDREADWEAARQNAMTILTRIGRHARPSPGRRILDFGSGWGFFLGAAKDVGWQCFGLEPLPVSAVYARARFAVDVTTDTLRDTSYPPEFFDVVTAVQVFEHLPNPAGDLARLHRFLKPGGLMLIEVPNFETWTMKLLGRRHRHFVWDHVNFFSALSLRRLLETNGFDVIDTYRPGRRLTIRHLLGYWGGRFLPRALVRLCQQTARVSGVAPRCVHLNVGDIVAMIGRKSG